MPRCQASRAHAGVRTREEREELAREEREELAREEREELAREEREELAREREMNLVIQTAFRTCAATGPRCACMARCGQLEG
jgi:hypothetical protein